MTISKLLPILVSLAAGAACLSASAEDNAAQSAARVALAKQLFAESPAPTNSAPAATAPTTQENEKGAKAKAKQEKAAAKAKAKQDAEKARSEKAAAEAEAEANARAAKQAQARQAALAASANTNVAANVTKEEKEKEKEKAKPGAPKSPEYAGQELGMKPMAAPALPISASKEDRLQALLEKYKADQISPGEYHKQRAAILSEP
jgi:hypothetical protein